MNMTLKFSGEMNYGNMVYNEVLLMMTLLNCLLMSGYFLDRLYILFKMKRMTHNTVQGRGRKGTQEDSKITTTCRQIFTKGTPHSRTSPEENIQGTLKKLKISRKGKLFSLTTFCNLLSFRALVTPCDANVHQSSFKVHVSP